MRTATAVPDAAIAIAIALGSGMPVSRRYPIPDEVNDPASAPA